MAMMADASAAAGPVGVDGLDEGRSILSVDRGNAPDPVTGCDFRSEVVEGEPDPEPTEPIEVVR